MSKESNKEKKRPFNLISGMWRRFSASRVGSDGKPEPYYYGTNNTGKDLLIKPGAKIYLYPHTNWKKGQANFFLKFQEPTEEEEGKARAKASGKVSTEVV